MIVTNYFFLLSYHILSYRSLMMQSNFSPSLQAKMSFKKGQQIIDHKTTEYNNSFESPSIKDAYHPDPAHQPSTQKLCINFSQAGTCRFGDQCRYSHGTNTNNLNSNDINATTSSSSISSSSMMMASTFTSRPNQSGIEKGKLFECSTCKESFGSYHLLKLHNKVINNTFFFIY